MSHIFLVCLDSSSAGRFFSPHLSREVRFSSLSDFLMLADSQCIKPTLSQNSVRQYAFGDVYEAALETDTPEGFNAITLNSRGEMATFLVTIHQRNHATWQGSIRWVEGKTEAYFRSAIELLRIMYSVL